MKKAYVKPMVQFEEFELNTAIAAGCESTVSLGPGDAANPVCKEYDQSPWSLRGRASDPLDITFYEGSCSCYLSSVGSTLLTS